MMLIFQMIGSKFFPVRLHQLNFQIPVFLAIAMISSLCSRTALIAADVDVKVLSFNVFHADTTSVSSRTKLAEIIQASGANLVGIQELDTTQTASIVSRLTTLTGKQWYSLQQSVDDEQILSTFPIIQAAPTITETLSGIGVQPTTWGAQVEITPGHNAWIFNAHVNSRPYQPEDLRDGTLAQNEAAIVAAAQNARGATINSILNYISITGAKNDGKPVFITGDFNEPSHLDWTQAAANSTPRSYDLKVAWPNSIMVAQAGFTDIYRQIHPNELTSPGYTWTPGVPSFGSAPPTTNPNDVHDRIDFVYSTGATVTAVSANTIGYPDGNVNTEANVAGYNSDHRAVIANSKVEVENKSTLTFSNVAANGANIPQTYGDRLVTSPNIVATYSATGAGVWKTWEGNNWNLGGAANLDSGGEESANGSVTYSLTLTPDANFNVMLTSFELIDWADSDGVGQSVMWELVQSNGNLLKSGLAVVADGSRLLVNTSVEDSSALGLTLRLQHLSGSNNDLAIDNIAFHQVNLIPEPSTLLLIGGSCLGWIRHRFVTQKVLERSSWIEK
jgi:exodeoxyribonuclease III